MNKKALLISFQMVLLFVFCIISILGAKKIIDENWASAFFMAMPLCAFAGSIYTVKRYSVKNPHGRAFFILSIGVGLVFVAEAISFLEKSLLHGRTLNSCGGIIFLLSFLFLISGLFMEMRIGSVSLSWKKIAFFMPVVVITLGIFYYFGISSLSLFGLINASLFFVGLLVMTIAFEYEKGRIFFAWLMLGIGCVLMILGDILFDAFSGLYDTASPMRAIIGLFWFFAYSLFSLGLFSFGFMLDDEEAISLERMKMEKVEENI